MESDGVRRSKRDYAFNRILGGVVSREADGVSLTRWPEKVGLSESSQTPASEGHARRAPVEPAGIGPGSA